jgi:PRTRC genetic system protein C
MFKSTVLKRVFIYKGKNKDVINLADPNPALTPEEVLDHYSGEYPELLNAFVLPGDAKGDIMEFEVKSNFGDKG